MHVIQCTKRETELELATTQILVKAGEDQEQRAMAGKVTDVFDKLYYDFMTTVTKKDYQTRILDQFKDCTVKLKDNPSDARSYVVEIKSIKRGNKRPEEAMVAINDMFSDTIRRVHSHCAKVTYDMFSGTI
ncbi:hypothetical protein EB796_003817 [Bugula neritina]|uniref:Uncharacterized protein n=1 Tax=Bugula neritina TaxID=10212 RepID=A0A7J7KKK3_BUGNE|nr:hypothetical protein EB796_003817 [Bugula neritina]